MGIIQQIRHNFLQAMPEVSGLIRRDLPHFIYDAIPVENEIPVFSFHSIGPSTFRSLLTHLARNNYATVSMDEVFDHLVGNSNPKPNRVALTFDDGWSTAWSVATPILKEFNMKATLFVAPQTVTDAAIVRKTISDGISEEQAVAEDRQPQNYLISWKELDAMLASGVWDIQSHTLFHTRVWSGDAAIDFVNPSLFKVFHGKRPGYYMVSEQNDIIAPSDMPLGWPIYPDVSRMSGTQRYIPDPQEGPHLAKYVNENGGIDFFQQHNWKTTLENEFNRFRKSISGRWETIEETRQSLEYELLRSKEIIEQRTGKTVRHLLFPWEEGSSEATSVAKQLGYHTACWGVIRNRRSNYPGDDPLLIPRVSWKFLPLLPGEGRISLSSELLRRTKNRILSIFH